MAKIRKSFSTAEDQLVLDHWLNRKRDYNVRSLEALQGLFKRYGYKRSLDSLRNRAHRLRRKTALTAHVGRQKTWFEGAKFGYFDIETYGFKANFAQMLSWAMFIPDKVAQVNDDGTLHISKKGKTLHDFMTRKEAIDPSKLDRRITQSALDAINEVDIVVGYYSTNFDIPFMRTKASMHGLEFPRYQEKWHYDAYFTVKSLFSLSRKTLEQACAMFGIAGKTHVDYALWDEARLGMPKAMKYVDDHCVADVEILAELHRRISGYRPLVRRSL
jgi:uncharacterized protein YprB with RNaseH-like and TPR domain